MVMRSKKTAAPARSKAAEVAELVASMRAQGVRRLRMGDIEIDLDEAPAAPPDPPSFSADDGKDDEGNEPSGDLYEHPDLYGGAVPRLTRREPPPR